MNKKSIFKILFAVVLFIYLIPLLSYFLPKGLDRDKTRIFFLDTDTKFKDTFIFSHDRKIRFVTSGNDTMPILLFIHGSPGSWDDYKNYLTDTNLQKMAYLISVDRPGYGQSGPIGVSTLAEQVSCIDGALKLRKNQKLITVFGHSYGGPVAVKFAIKHLELIQKIILISPVISPEIEKGIYWKKFLQNIGQLRLWHWMLSENLKNCSREMRALPDELLVMEKAYHLLTVPIVEIHGTEDVLAPFGNQEYVKNHFVNTSVDTIIMKDKNHFILFNHPDKIIQIIKDEIGEIQKQ